MSIGLLYAAKWIMQQAIANRPHIFGFVSPRLPGDSLLEVWNDDTGTDVAFRVDPDGISGDAVDALKLTIYPDYHTAANQAAMLALTAKQGDVASRTDTLAKFMLTGTNPAVLGNWTLLVDPAVSAAPTNALAWGASQNDVATAGYNTLRLAPTANVDATGFADGADGDLVVLLNVSATYTVTLKHESASSVAANRMSLKDSVDIAMVPGSSVVLQYDGTSSRWRVHAWGGLGASSNFDGGTPSAPTGASFSGGTA